ncbi:MAG: hypothetical protein K2I46_01580 [Clostridia bacterium]|nr:hypothetical protein [Clostridia bacterium]MDE6472521.1 hypothetical protein [Clostridia bacterium]
MERYSPQALMFSLLALQTQAKIENDKSIGGIQKEVLEKRKNLLRNAIENDKPLMNLFIGVDIAQSEFQTAIVTHYYKEGFIYGAQLMLEICGYENKGSNDEKLDKLLNYLDSSDLDKINR